MTVGVGVASGVAVASGVVAVVAVGVAAPGTAEPAHPPRVSTTTREAQSTAHIKPTVTQTSPQTQKNPRTILACGRTRP